MKTLYIVYQDMQVINCNLSSSYLTMDLSQNAYIGFAHNLARYLAEKLPIPDELADEEQAILLGKEKVFSIIKQLDFYQGYASFTGHLNDNNHKALNIPMNPPEIKGSIKHTVIVALEIAEEDNKLAQYADEFIQFNRFSGGDIQPMSSKKIHIIVHDDDALQTLLENEKGWLIQNANDELQAARQKTETYNQAFNDCLSTFVTLKPKGDNKEAEKQRERKLKGWYFASLAGYQLLEAPKSRTNARHDLPHAFAEPIIGLHKLIYYRKQKTKDLFWQAKRVNNTYLISQKF